MSGYFEKGVKKPWERCELVKSEAPTDPRYGCAPEERPIRELIEKGIVNIDKPPGPTSHEVVIWVKDILRARKAAHTGTLDPKVTGVLPVLLGVATKLARVFLGDKEYFCVMRLHKEVEEERLRKVCKEFTGRIYQRPPVKSAVKRRIRVKKVHYIEIKEVEGKEVLMRVGCEAGTYVRMLCHHIGLALGVGAHMFQLRRTKSFPFSEDTAVKLHDLKDAYVIYEEEGDDRLLREKIIPMEYALSHIPAVVVRDTAVDAISHGADVAAPGILRLEKEINIGDLVIIYTQKGEAVGMGVAKMGAEEILKAEKGICIEVEKVFMKTGIYPRCWKSRGG
ncbi:MAG: RNA-guided pseudouridylation complex pseudouridine synthase subunit Cbf5 [Candidatus Methanospirareceae archaeon]